MLKKILALSMVLFTNVVYAETIDNLQVVNLPGYPKWEPEGTNEPFLSYEKIFSHPVSLSKIPKNYKLELVQFAPMIIPVPIESLHYPLLLEQEKEMLKNSIDIHSINEPKFWINIKGLNTSNILDFSYHLKYNIKKHIFTSQLNGKEIDIPAKEIYVKKYSTRHENYLDRACGINIKTRHYYMCKKIVPVIEGYQKYIIPKDYSLHQKSNNDIRLYITRHRVLYDGKHIDNGPYVSYLSDIKKYDITLQNSFSISYSLIEKWFKYRKISYIYHNSSKYNFPNYISANNDLYSIDSIRNNITTINITQHNFTGDKL